MTAIVENNAPHFGMLDAANLGSGLTVGGSLSIWLTQNATAIGIGVAVFTALMTLVFYALTYFANIRGQNIRRSEIERDVYKDILDHATPEQKDVIMDLIRGE